MADIIEYPLTAIERITVERNRLTAEVERLQAQLAAARESIDLGWPAPAHGFYCGYWRGPDGYDSRLCDCDVEQRKNDRAHARRALGLEPMPAPPEPQAVTEVPNG